MNPDEERRDADDDVIVDPVTGCDVHFRLEDIPAPSVDRSVTYCGCVVSAGPVEHFYVGAVFMGNKAIAILGPAANSSTALLLARRWVDSIAPRVNAGVKARWKRDAEHPLWGWLLFRFNRVL